MYKIVPVLNRVSPKMGVYPDMAYGINKKQRFVNHEVAVVSKKLMDCDHFPNKSRSLYIWLTKLF